MIKIIKHGKTEFTHTCSRCGCEFTYEYEDIKINTGNISTAIAIHYITCPDCGNTCYIDNNSDKIDWSWLNIPPIPNIPLEGLHPCSNCDWWKKMQTPGFTYVGDTPCTWCNKSPNRTICGNNDISISTNSTTPKLQIFNNNTKESL